MITKYSALLVLIIALETSAAVRGGTYNYNLSSRPASLNPIRSTDASAGQVIGMVIESLASYNQDTWELVPELATSWKISKDRKVYTVNLRKGVLWHDGKSFTAEDVKFSFDAITDPQNRYGTAHIRSYYKEIKEVVIVDPYKIHFIIEGDYFNTFNIAMTMSILPKHIYQDTSRKVKRRLNKEVWGSGPYKFKTYEKNKFIELVENESWWGRSDNSRKGEANYSKIRFKFIDDSEMTIRRLERGDLDFISLTPNNFYKSTFGPKWGSQVFKVKTRNKSPSGYKFIGLNMEDKRFASIKVRKALYHLVNRDMMIKKFLYNDSHLATGPWYRQSPYADSSVPPVVFDPQAASKLLKEDGWADSDGDRVLDKMIDGKRVSLRFTILEAKADFIKFLVLFKEDAKKAGIDIKIKRVEWNALLKLLEERKFSAVSLEWAGGSIDIDPKQIWHSSSLPPGGSNFISYKNLEVDRLIDLGRREFDKEKRIQIFKRVFRLIAEDVPYIFLFNRKSILYAHTKRMKRVKDTYNYSVGEMDFWWIVP